MECWDRLFDQVKDLNRWGWADVDGDDTPPVRRHPGGPPRPSPLVASGRQVRHPPKPIDIGHSLELRTAKGPARVTLYWIPLGAGGAAMVRVSGRIYEAMRALIDQRRPLDLYHSALEVQLGADRYIIENAWPSPDSDSNSRGVVVEGPVLSPLLARSRVFRYEIRCWRDGIIADEDHAVRAQIVTREPTLARRVLDCVGSIPDLTWGRALPGSREMWNSNSVISYLLVTSGLSPHEYLPPSGGRAPGWATGIVKGRAVRDLSASARDLVL